VEGRRIEELRPESAFANAEAWLYDKEKEIDNDRPTTVCHFLSGGWDGPIDEPLVSLNVVAIEAKVLRYAILSRISGALKAHTEMQERVV